MAITTVTDLIKVLQKVENEHGDVPIYLIIKGEFSGCRATNHLDSLTFVESIDCSKMADIQTNRYVNLVWAGFSKTT